MAFFAARQPILDIDKQLFAYELLFRESLDNVFPETMDAEEATSRMVEGLQFNLGLDCLTQNKCAFINFTHESLIKQYPQLLPNDQVVVEVLETVKPGKQLLAAIIELKEKGYTIALDDYIHHRIWLHFFPYIDIIKIDWKETSLETIKKVIEAIKTFPHIKLLAEKIESHDEFNIAVGLGFSYFQGYFFSQPEVLQSRAISASQMSLANLMVELSQAEPDIDSVTRVIEQDVNLSFKLLRYTQSPLFKRRSEISTIKHALSVLGNQELRRFISVLFTAQFADNKPPELTNMSLVRACFCESLACLTGHEQQKESAFLIGLLSLLDALLDTSLEELLEKLPLTDNIKQALLNHHGIFGQFLELLTALEHADWPKVTQLEKSVNISKKQAGELYQGALQWANQRQEYG
ncbi:EAL and HDOD domain-containing protein [Neptunicella sp. SCSIO 80796]|uniref:EAL and HDOD domain-containing protein n=1 Tax=Neptunicella plasticusilytica TaxID=3117012 RepID=UPI003A4DEC74